MSIRALSAVTKRSEHETELCPQSSTKVKNGWHYTPAPSIYLYDTDMGEFSLSTIVLNLYIMPYLYRELEERQRGAANITNGGPLFNNELAFTIFHNLISIFSPPIKLIYFMIVYVHILVVIHDLEY
jgi:hypothetical protein